MAQSQQEPADADTGARAPLPHASLTVRVYIYIYTSSTYRLHLCIVHYMLRTEDGFGAVLYSFSEGFAVCFWCVGGRRYSKGLVEEGNVMKSVGF